MPVSEYINSGIRHGIKAANGWNDEDHSAMAAWNFICAMETQWMVQQGYLPLELDDVQNFLTAEGIAKAFEEIRAENKERLKRKALEEAAVKQDPTEKVLVPPDQVDYSPIPPGPYKDWRTIQGVVREFEKGPPPSGTQLGPANTPPAKSWALANYDGPVWVGLENGFELLGQQHESGPSVTIKA
jgi:hypothetical protein